MSAAGRTLGEALSGAGELAELDEATLATALARPRPFRAEPGATLRVAGLMVAAAVVPALAAARRAIAEGGAYLNNRRVTAADAIADESDLLHGRYLVLRRGKRTIGAVEVPRKPS